MSRNFLQLADRIGKKNAEALRRLQSDGLVKKASRLEPTITPTEFPSPWAQEFARLEKGGIGQITSFKGGSKTWFALLCVRAFLEQCHGDPPLSLWISDEGVLYPGTLQSQWKIPLSRLLLVKTEAAKDVWNVGLESVQTGLFSWILMRPSQACSATHLRKLQLCAESSQTRVLLLYQPQLPHWTIKAVFKVYENSLLPNPIERFESLQRSLLGVYSQSLLPQP